MSGMFGGFGGMGGVSEQTLGLPDPVTVAHGGTGRTDGTLYDNAGTPRLSIDWYGRKLQIYSGGSQRTIFNWATGALYDPGTYAQVIDLSTGSLLTTAGATSVDWEGFTLASTGDKLAMDWGLRKLYDVAATTKLSIDFNARKLYDTDGTTEVADWDAHSLSGKWTGYIQSAITDLGNTGTGTITPTVDTAETFKAVATGNFTLGNPSGTPVDGQKFTLRIRQDATGSRTITFDTQYRFGTDIPSPTLTTTAAKQDYLAFMWSSADSKWDCVAVTKGY